MLKDIKKAIQDFLDNHSLSGKKSNFEPKIFGNDVNLRSASDNGKYLASVLHILADQKNSKILKEIRHIWKFLNTFLRNKEKNT